MIITDNETVNAAEDLIRRHKEQRPEKPRTVQAILARYNQAISQYQDLMQAQVDNREQRVMLYSEIKTLGWCLGREEAKIVKEINTPVK
ncbi:MULTISPECIES: hypothetical protein [Selenomonas]|jgi:hypothetical protein|uniref:Uncharacterized protein n=1 Tax=Selenomonas ruminantium TaxID=971 RepID=A0A1K1PL87_SELRU|nr:MULTISPECIES: hypothetical protein [Selenomonas]SFA89301.1 hypothetical protein SAMN05216587_10382 [Selenomonas ruminantium]SFW48498.1 hypothetical protein SAMN02910323_2081 [Selenomonas ruminantium]